MVRRKSVSRTGKDYSIYTEGSPQIRFVRVISYNGFSPVESFYIPNKPEPAFTIELEEGQTVWLDEYERNRHFLEVKIVSTRPDEKGHYRVYGTAGYASVPYLRLQTERPPHEDGNFAERWKKNHSGRGGSSGNGWDFLWIGGR